MIDLQMSKVAQPTIDLAYFFGASLTPEQRSDERTSTNNWIYQSILILRYSDTRRHNHLDELLCFYHSVLSAKLTDLGHDPEHLLSLGQLKRDYQECRMFEYMTTLMHTVVS